VGSRIDNCTVFSFPNEQEETMTVDRSAEAFRYVALALMLMAFSVGTLQLLGLVRF